MLSFIVRRLVIAVVLLIGAITIVFLLLRVAPGDPASILMGPQATPEEIASARERMGLDRSIAVQYGIYIRQIVNLDLGDSAISGESIGSMIAQRMPATIVLAVVAVVLAIVVALPSGVIAALRPNGWWDRIASVGSLAGQSSPSFWIGIMLLLILSRRLNWLPSAGADSWRHLIMPAATLALPLGSVLFRLTRSGLLETLREPYIEAARAKGLTRRRVITLHALRNMLLPVVTVVGLQLGQLLGGAVIVEEVFSWPGVGRMILTAIEYRDYSVVQAGMIVLTGAFVLANLAVDVAYAQLDPRVRLA